MIWFCYITPMIVCQDHLNHLLFFRVEEETVTNKKIPVEDITEFYYTYENINYNASY